MAVALTPVLALQPDFGQAGLIIATWALMYFAAGAPVLLLGGVGAAVDRRGLVRLRVTPSMWRGGSTGSSRPTSIR